MYLKRLELHGFKSFAHKTILAFEPGLTAIVGPNGSGKSNLADAIRWVTGEQSLKLLRGKKSEDVIFAGSDKKTKLSLAEVALTFDNRDHKLPFEYSEVVIARRLYRDGESEYLINNQKCRLLDIVEALLKSGFGATNYAVIGQGTIDQLVLAGPSEIKGLVEEASGVKPYYLKREKTLRRLAQTRENLVQVSQLVAEIEPRLRSLKRQAKRMEEREAVSAQLLSLQLVFFGSQFYQLEAELSAIEEQAAKKNSATKKLELEIEGFQKTLEKDERQSGRTDAFLEEIDRKLKSLEERRLFLAEKLAEIKGKLKVELPATKNFSEFRRQFEAILEALRADNIAEIKQRLKDLVSTFGETKNEELEKQKRSLTSEFDYVVAQMNEQQNAKNKTQEAEKHKKNFLTLEEKKFRAKTLQLQQMKDELNAVLIDQARIETRLENLAQEGRQALGEKFDNLPQHKQPEAEPDLAIKIAKLKHQLELTGGVDEAVMAEYRETAQRFDYLTTQSRDLSQGVADLEAIISDLDEVITKQFDEAFDKISTKFSEYFRILFNGGRANMSLLRSEVVRTEAEQEMIEEEISPEEAAKTSKEIIGIEIKATPPGKKLATIASLSGGERALTAIALLCSMLASYPSPFVVLDEVDAALDEANSIRFAKILGTLADQTQFITITHNRETMRQGHTLYGVTMGDDGISKVLSVKLERAEAIAE